MNALSARVVKVSVGQSVDCPSLLFQVFLKNSHFWVGRPKPLGCILHVNGRNVQPRHTRNVADVKAFNDIVVARAAPANTVCVSNFLIVSHLRHQRFCPRHCWCVWRLRPRVLLPCRWTFDAAPRRRGYARQHMLGTTECCSATQGHWWGAPV